MRALRNYWILSSVTVSAAFGILTLGGGAFAATPTAISTIGDWTLFCTSGVEKPSMSDCAIAGGAISDRDSNLWVRIGLAFDSEGANAKMIIRIPLTNYTDMRKGIFISTDVDDIGRVSIDECEKAKVICRSSVGMVARNFNALFAAKKLNVQYQTEVDKGVSLSVSMEGFLAVFEELQKKVGIKKKLSDGTPVASIATPNASTYSVTLGSAPDIYASESKQRSHLAKSNRCRNAAEPIVIRADQVEKFEALATKWAAAAEKCHEGRVVIITPNFDQPYEAKAGMNVYDLAKINRLAKYISASSPTQNLDLVYQDVDGTPVQIGAYYK